MGAPYALSSDLVSAWPAKSLEVAQYIDGQVPLLAMTQNAQTGTTYTFVAADFTKLVTLSNASPVAVTLPLEATVPWPTGTQLRLLNQGAGTVTVAGAVGVTINGTPLTLAQYKGANLIKTGTNTWTFVPFASGVGAAVYSDANTGTYTGYAYKTFTASGTFTITTAGFADIAVVGGGGGGGSSDGAGGGGAGAAFADQVYLAVGTYTVKIGAGGVNGALTSGINGSGGNGSATQLGIIAMVGGGGGGGSVTTRVAGVDGGSGGGGCGGNAGSALAGGTATIAAYGNNGGAGAIVPNYAGGGGGGAAAAGSAGAVQAGGAGGAGTSTSIAGANPSSTYSAGSYAFGGGGGGGGGDPAGTGGAGGSGGGGAGQGDATAAVAGSANTGGGGGGSDLNDAKAGGSGLVIVRVAV